MTELEVDGVVAGYAIATTGFDLEVERDNVAPLGLYRKAGFSAHDRIPMTERLA